MTTSVPAREPNPSSPPPRIAGSVHLKTLAITGYTLVEAPEELKEESILDVIRKPFDVETLAQIVRRTLDAFDAD
jgi:DNA-binding NtrC family response regulator